MNTIYGEYSKEELEYILKPLSKKRFITSDDYLRAFKDFELEKISFITDFAMYTILLLPLIIVYGVINRIISGKQNHKIVG